MDSSKVRRRTWLALLALLPLLVAGCAKGRSSSKDNGASALPTLKVSVTNFVYSGMPDTLPRGQRAIEFTNKESFPVNHEMVLMSLSGKQSADMIADAKKKDQAAEDDWLHFGEVADVGTGATKVSLFDLPPGTYAIACYQKGTPKGTETGPPHLTIGMIKQFTVS